MSILIKILEDRDDWDDAYMYAHCVHFYVDRSVDVKTTSLSNTVVDPNEKALSPDNKETASHGPNVEEKNVTAGGDESVAAPPSDTVVDSNGTVQSPSSEEREETSHHPSDGAAVNSGTGKDPQTASTGTGTDTGAEDRAKNQYKDNAELWALSDVCPISAGRPTRDMLTHVNWSAVLRATILTDPDFLEETRATETTGQTDRSVPCQTLR
jgi:hypothetical protein